MGMWIYLHVFVYDMGCIVMEVLVYDMREIGGGGGHRESIDM